jgi:hypothetical protein
MRGESLAVVLIVLILIASCIVGYLVFNDGPGELPATYTDGFCDGTKIINCPCEIKDDTSEMLYLNWIKNEAKIEAYQKWLQNK